MYTLELKDRTKIKVHDAPHENSFTVDVVDAAELAVVKAKLTKENLKEFKLIEAEGMYSVVSNKCLDSTYHVKEKEEYLEVTFNLRDVSIIEQQLLNIQQGQEIQDLAILDLAQMQGGE